MDPYLAKLLGSKEEVLLIARQHWLVLALEIVSESVLSLAWIVLITMLIFMAPIAPWAFGYLLVLLPLISLTRDVMVWLNRQYVVTTRRVIQVAGVINKDVTDSSLDKVNDVKMMQSVWGRLLNYGDVEILTASELGVNLFKRIQDPIRFKTAMLNAKETMANPNARKDTAPLPAAAPIVTPMPPPTASLPSAPSIPDMIKQLDALRQAGVLTEAEFQNKKNELLQRL